MINRFLIWLVLLPKAIFTKMGVNIHQLKAILKAKLLMDDRRPNTLQQTQSKKRDKPITGATYGLMIGSIISGCFFLVSFFISKDIITQFTVYFSFFIFMLSATLISDFTSVLIDIRDNYIILPKPVNDRTFLLSKLLHITIHASKLIIPLSLPAIILVGIKYGIIGMLGLLFLTIPVSLLTIFLINAVYVFVLKVTTPEKFKNFISYFQIAFTIFIYAAYQLVPRMIDKSVFQQYTLPRDTTSLLFPPVWFAGAWQYIYRPEWNWFLLSSLVLSLAVPALSIYVVIKYFAPSFNQKLAMISGSEQQEAVILKNDSSQKSKKTPLAYYFANLLTQNKLEKAGFLHTWFITGRSREFKMRIYPALGYIIVYLVLMFLRTGKKNGIDLSLKSNSGIFVSITAIYFISFVILQVLAQLPYSDKYKASWIFLISPISKPGPILNGSVKAAIIKFYLPLALLVSISGILFLGPSIIPNLLLGMSNQLLLCFIIAYISYRSLPFAQLENTSLKRGSFLRGLISLAIPLLTATAHFLVFKFTIAIWILFCLSVIANWLIIGSIFKKEWKDLSRLYT